MNLVGNVAFHPKRKRAKFCLNLVEEGGARARAAEQGPPRSEGCVPLPGAAERRGKTRSGLYLPSDHRGKV